MAGSGSWQFQVYVAIKRNGQEAACASVVRNWAGMLIDGNVAFARIYSPLQGELIAIPLACGMARSLRLNGAVIESDNQVAIKLSVFELVTPWEVGALVLDIRQMKQECGQSLAWVKREANRLAHVVASKALRSFLPSNWVASPPDCVASV